MKTNLVVWGKNNDNRVLIALQLNAGENKVDFYSFNAEETTEDFVKSLFEEWKEGKEVSFPEGANHKSLELKISESLLPQGYSSEEEALLSKTQAEWHYVVLSSRLHNNYSQELADIEEKIQSLTEFKNEHWEELKNFWAKVQKQIQERTLFKNHGEELRSRTNQLFDQLKEFRRKLDESFRSESAENLQKFKSLVEGVEEKIDSGLSLQPIFEELKSLQNEFNKASFTKGDRGRVWDKIDGAFKKLKAKRYGTDGGAKAPGEGTERIDRRIQGLQAAIAKMETSIEWDNKDLSFENKRASGSEGQLEAQLRQAKINMIEERIASKRVKLEDMKDTLSKLNTKKEGILKKLEEQKEQQKIKEVKEELKDRIKSEIKEKTAELIDNEEVKKAAEKLGLLGKAVDKTIEQAREVAQQAESMVENMGEAISETLQDLSKDSEEEADKKEEE
jgi:hypothetical protein